MTQEKKNGKIIAIITMIFLFGMISFVTNLAAPMGIVLKNQFDVSNCTRYAGKLRKLHRVCSNGYSERHLVATRWI